MSSLPQGGFRQRTKTGRRRALVWGVLLFLFLVMWSALVLSWGAPSDEAGGSQGSRSQPDTSQEDAGATRGSGGDGEHEAVPDEPAYAQGDAAGATAGGEAPASSKPAVPGATPTGQDGPAGAGGRRSEPENFRPDPLGTGASEGDLAPVDEERVRFAAARFVTAAYGYSGHDEDAYNQGVGQTVAWPVFYESPGSKEIKRYAAQVGDTGTKSGALLNRFERIDSGPTTVTGYAYFRTGGGYRANGELTGKKISYRQQMTLVRSGGAWVVKATNAIERI